MPEFCPLAATSQLHFLMFLPALSKIATNLSSIKKTCSCIDFLIGLCWNFYAKYPQGGDWKMKKATAEDDGQKREGERFLFVL